MQRRIPKIATSSNRNILFSESNQGLLVDGTWYHEILRFGSRYTLSFSFIRTFPELGSIEIPITDPDHKAKLDELCNFFGLDTGFIGDTDENTIRYISNKLGSPVLMLIKHLINQGIEVTGSEGHELTTGDKRKLLEGRLLANLEFAPLMIIRDGIKNININLRKIEIIAENDVFGRWKNLPDVGEFINMSIEDRLKHYKQQPKRIDNETGSYILVVAKRNQEFYIVERNSADVMMRSQEWLFVPTDKAFAMMGDFPPTSLDIEDGRFHYRVVLSYGDTKYRDALNSDRQLFKEGLMRSAEEYLSRRKIDIRGMWYDEGRQDRRSHINLHIVSDLPKTYFSLLFDIWNKSFGLVWCGYAFEALGWRVYAARNHHLLEQKGGRYVSKGEVYKAFFDFLQNVLRKGSRLLDLPHELIYEIMDYTLIWNDLEKALETMKIWN